MCATPRQQNVIGTRDDLIPLRVTIAGMNHLYKVGTLSSRSYHVGRRRYIHTYMYFGRLVLAKPRWAAALVLCSSAVQCARCDGGEAPPRARGRNHPLATAVHRRRGSRVYRCTWCALCRRLPTPACARTAADAGRSATRL